MYINPKGEFPRYIGDIQLENADFKEGDKLPTGWVQYFKAEKPTVGKNQVAYESQPQEVDGVMTQNWQVRDMTAEEIERRDAPKRAKEKLMALGLTELEIEALLRGLVR